MIFSLLILATFCLSSLRNLLFKTEISQVSHMNSMNVFTKVLIAEWSNKRIKFVFNVKTSQYWNDGKRADKKKNKNTFVFGMLKE